MIDTTEIAAAAQAAGHTRLVEAEVAAARRRVIEQKLAELDDFERAFTKSKRRFRMAAFLRWQTAAAERKRRNGDQRHGHGKRRQ
jgi:hypothetical protein